MEGFACSHYVCGEGQDFKPLWVTLPSPHARLDEKDRKEGRGEGFGEGAVFFWEPEEIYAKPWCATYARHTNIPIQIQS